MIPKIIHYCWFGGNPLPELAIKCIESWKKYLPDYGEFYEARQFTPGFEKCVEVEFDGYLVPFGMHILFN